MPADDELTRAHRLFAEAQALAHLGVWELDVVAGELYWSEELYQILGLAPREVPATFEELLARVHPEDATNVKGYLARARRERSPSALEYRIVRPGGEIRTLAGRVRAAFDGSGTLLRLIGTDQDITAADAPKQRHASSVLVIDDDRVFASSLRRMLAGEHNVTVVHTGREALATVRSGERFDAILCDLMMPELTGAELHAELSETDRGQAERMIFITGGAFSPASQRFLERVTNLCFEKPCDIAELRAAVRRRVAAEKT